MKTVKFRLLPLLFLLLALQGISANRITRQLYRSFPANQVQKLDLNTKYGNIYIENNRSDSVVIAVEIWAEGKEEKARQLLQNIQIEVNQSGKTVSGVTNLQDSFSGNIEFSIDYHIAIPANRELQIIHKYGSVNLNDLSANGDIEVKYGELNGRRLVCPTLNLDIAYGKLNIDQVENLNLNLRYSKMKLGVGHQVKIESRYSGIQIEESQLLGIDSKYDNIRIGKIDELSLNSMYTHSIIDNLSGLLNLTNSYGDFSTDRVAAGFRQLKIENRYATIHLGILPEANYKLNAHAKYCNIDHPGGRLNRMYSNGSYQVEGTVGKPEEAKGSVEIETSYGNVSLTR